MNEGINLITPQEKKAQERSNLFLKSAIWILSCCLLLSFTVIIYDIALQAKFSALSGEKTKLEDNLNAATYKVSKIVLLRERLIFLGDILKKREDLSLRINFVNKNIPYGANVESFDLDKDLLSFSVSSADLYSIDKLINNIYSAADIKSYFKSANISSLAYDQKTGKYLLNMDLQR